MSSSTISRRNFFGMTAGAVATTGLAPLLYAGTPQAGTAQASNATHPYDALPANDPETYRASIDSAYTFLDTMMDAYAQGATVRLIQSYSDQIGLLSTAFTYDNAVAIHAYLVRGRAEDVERAEVLGNGLIYAQANNVPVSDGRFAQAYFVNVPASDGSGAFISPAAAPFFFFGSAVGDQAWAGMALAQLYRRTRNAAYLQAALKVANWIVTNTFDTRGPGGYTFGTNINQLNQSVPSPNGKSTEHNIDTYAFFTMLAELTRGGSATNGTSWSQLARHAFVFVQAMFNPEGHFFYTGTNTDQVTINTSNIPEDVQTWSYLAFLDNRYKRSIDYALTHLQTTDSATAPHSSLTGTQQVTGETFASASLISTAGDPHAVWLEGTGHTVAALIARILAGREGLHGIQRDVTAAVTLLRNIGVAQSQLGTGQTVHGVALVPDQGIVAATSPLDTGFGFSYFPNLHVGATGWYVIAALGGNPFQLGERSDWES
jgi:hypothetical protein